MLKEIGSVFSFLTIIPTNNASLEGTAKYMHIFPLVGIIIGLLIGSIGFGLSLFLDPMIVSLLVVASIAVITGIHHTCLLYTSQSPRDATLSRMPSSA